jgi:hypothetical protein
MNKSEKDFKNWLVDHGYDYETHFDDIKLWNQYIIVPSSYTTEELMDECCEISSTTGIFEEVDNSGYQKQIQIEDEFISWKMKNWRTFDLNATEMDLYFQFMVQRENNAFSGSI